MLQRLMATRTHLPSIRASVLCSACAQLAQLLWRIVATGRHHPRVTHTQRMPRDTHGCVHECASLTSLGQVTLDYRDRLNRRRFGQNLEKFLQAARPLLAKA
jgi:hypothetical protein